MFDMPFLSRNADDDCELQAQDSSLVARLQSANKAARMPRYGPNIDPARQQFYREWVDAQAPDNEPPGQIGVYHERTPNPEPASSPSAPLPLTPRYAEHVRQLFRPFDEDSLQHFDGIDLDDVDAVRAAAPSRRRFEAGSLPYDASWSPRNIALFGRWVDTGMP